MNPLTRALIEKTGYDHGFETVLPAADISVVMASARHRCQTSVTLTANGYALSLHASTPALLAELRRSFPAHANADDPSFNLATLPALATLLQRAAQLAQALPDQVLHDYQADTLHAFTERTSHYGDGSADHDSDATTTDIERLTRQRLGQARYRDALLAYWNGACAVTGVAVTAALRASHAKPWVACTTDAERLDVFNGFLLLANLDALFDRFLISFDDHGKLLAHPSLPARDRATLGIHPELRLRWLAPAHLPYLHWHRARFAGEIPSPLPHARA